MIKGVGLYFVKRFVKEYDGQITIFNTSEQGACVEMTLPLR